MKTSSLNQLFGALFVMTVISWVCAVAFALIALDDHENLTGLSVLSRTAENIDPELNLTAYPDAIVQLNKTFTAVVAIPDSILDQGDDATTTWLKEQGIRGSIHPDNYWQQTECALAILAFLGSNLIAAAKILKIKKYIGALGGVAEAVKLLLKCSTTEEMLRAGGAALVNLVAEILGIPAVAKACT